MPFKPDFLWGASTSAYQVEGASAEDGKGPSVQDIKTLPPGTADFTVASDHYHRFREDIALMAEMGLKAYRFSIAWTRIYPQGDGPVNVRGLQHYSEVIDTCLAHGLTPIVTMYHFDLPAALDAAGGWNNRATIDAFVQYARTLFEQFGDRVKYWLTINEQRCGGHGRKPRRGPPHAVPAEPPHAAGAGTGCGALPQPCAGCAHRSGAQYLQHLSAHLRTGGCSCRAGF